MNKRSRKTVIPFFVAGAVCIGLLPYSFVFAQAIGLTVTTLAPVLAARNSPDVFAQANVSSPGRIATVWFEWGETPALGKMTTDATMRNTGVVQRRLFGLVPNTTYYYRAVAASGDEVAYGGIVSFISGSVAEKTSATGGTGSSGGAQVKGPAILYTYSATAQGGTAATLNGYLDPRGVANTKYWFEWGETDSLGKTTPRIAAETTSSAIGYSISGFKPDTFYYFRVVAQNSYGLVRGTTLVFKTGAAGTSGAGGIVTPAGIAVITNNAAQVTSNRMLLYGFAINPTEKDSSAWFEWGTTPALGKETVHRSIGKRSPVEFSRSLAGLSPDTTYYYRAVVQSASGIVRGNIVSSRTEPGRAAASRARAAEGTSTMPPSGKTPSETGDAGRDGMEKENGDGDSDGQAAVVVSGERGFFPHTLAGWLSVLFLIVLIVWASNRAYGSYKRMKEEEQKRARELTNGNVLTDTEYLERKPPAGETSLPGQEEAEENSEIFTK